jgi:hypothetical protein
VEDSDKADKVVPRADAFHAGEEKFEAGDITVDKKGGCLPYPLGVVTRASLRNV